MQLIFATAAAVALLLGGDLWALAQESQAQPLAEADFSTAFFKMLGGLALVLAVLVGLYWLTRRFASGGAVPGGGGGGGMKILGRLPLGQRKQLALVEVADRVLVLGVTQDDIRMLDKITGGKEIEQLRRVPHGGKGFVKAMKRAATSKESS